MTQTANPNGRTAHLNVQLAALATMRLLAVEHGEVFLTGCLAAVLMSRVVMPQARAVGALKGRTHMTAECARRIVMAIRENLPKET